MNGIVLSVVTGIIFLAGWNSANLYLEHQMKIEDEKLQASKNVNVYSRVKVVHGFHEGDE